MFKKLRVTRFNLLTQEGGYEHGSKPRRATISSVNHALRALRKLIAEERLTSEITDASLQTSTDEWRIENAGVVTG